MPPPDNIIAITILLTFNFKTVNEKMNPFPVPELNHLPTSLIKAFPNLIVKKDTALVKILFSFPSTQSNIENINLMDTICQEKC